MTFRAILAVLAATFLLAFFGVLGSAGATFSWTAVFVLVFAGLTHLLVSQSISLLNSVSRSCRETIEAREDSVVKNVDSQLQSLKSDVDSMRHEAEFLANC